MERTRLLAQRDDLNKPQLSSKTDAQRETAITQVSEREALYGGEGAVR